MTTRSAEILALAAASAAACCARGGSAADQREGPSAALRRLTGAHTRVVWCRQSGREEWRCRILGLDTDDGAGVRVIVAEPSFHTRPLITPDGAAVVFSDTAAGKVRVVSWDGSHVRDLADGVATDVWQDPADKAQWVYVAPSGEKGGSKPIRRVRLDRPSVAELVWDKVQVSWGWFTVSADGRFAGGAFPWPYCGIATLPNVAVRYMGGGCWPSIAPDNSYRLFVLTNSHRQVLMLDPADGSTRYIDLTAAPGVGGSSVHMPRWTNHARFLVMVGPKTHRGFQDAEVCVGRFDETFSTVEAWARITHNTVADTHPDAWIEPGGGPQAGVVAASRADPFARDPAGAPKRQRWPGDRRDAVFLWEDSSLKAARLGRAEPRGLAIYGRHFEMDLAGGSFVAEIGPEAVERLRAAGRFSIEATITPPAAAPDDKRTIMAFAPRKGPPNFTLSQHRDRLCLELRASAGTWNAVLCRVSPGRANHLVLTYDPPRLGGYLDGDPLTVEGKFTGDLRRWHAGRLVLGDDPAGGADWPGRLETVALHGRVIGPAEAAERLSLCAPRLARRAPPERLVLQGRLLQVTQTPTPKSIAPYRRCLVGHVYRVEDVLAGEYLPTRVLVAHWAILDGKVLPSQWRRGASYRLTLERYGANPQLETERFVMDGRAYGLRVYYEVHRSPPLPQARE